MRDELISMSDKYRQCRLWGHPWEPTTVTKDGAVFIQGLRCPRCEMERNVVVNRYGHNMGNKYKRPKDYRVEGGLSPKERNSLRLFEVKLKWK